MFDWNDEELTNIIWGEEDDTDDHIVPFKERSELNLNRKESESKITTPTDQKIHGARIDLHGRKLDSRSIYSANEGISSSDFGLGSWLESSLSKAAKTDQDSISIDVSNDLAEPTKYSSTNGAKTYDLGFHSANESKEQGDFVDYSWANIGSFDDLDRIFSNDVAMFGDGSLGGADELWSSSKDATNSGLKPFSATRDSLNLGLDIRTDHCQQDGQQFSLSKGVDDPSVHSIQNVSVTAKHEECPRHKNPSFLEQQTDPDSYGKTTDHMSTIVAESFSNAKNIVDKAYQKKKLLKFSKRSEENGEGRVLQDLYGSWAPSGNRWEQFDNQSMPSMLHPSLMGLNQQKKPRAAQASQFPHMSNPYVAASAYENLANPYSAMPVLSNVQSPDLKNQLLHSSYEVSSRSSISVNESADAAARPLTMTPREKIEKLRRKQQMQAMLAIQRQQQQFRHQVPIADQSVTQKRPQDNLLQHGDGANLENLTALLSFDSNSPPGQDDSNTVAATFDNSSAEYSALYRLQDVVAKMDTGIRLCIRDSFFRLARSAVQRHYATDTTSTNKTSQDEKVLAQAEARKSNRYAGIPDTEKETNPIDRTVAHLLFHRPLELSANNTETPESPASAKLGIDHKANFSRGTTTESSKLKQNTPQQGTIDPLVETQQIDQFEASENASNCGRSAGAGGGEVEASQ